MSSAMRFGDIAAVLMLGDVASETKFGDAAAALKSADPTIALESSDAAVETKFGDRATRPEVRTNVLFDTTGLELGEVANESVRLACAVAKRACKSGDEDPAGVWVGVSADGLGHTASPPASTWS